MKGILIVFMILWGSLSWSSAEEGSKPYPVYRQILRGLEWIECGAGPPHEILVLRVDPVFFGFRVFNFRAEGESQPIGVQEWMVKTGAIAVFNAGQYYPDWSYMGFLLSQGKTIKGKLHPLFQAMFVAEPVNKGFPLAGILDLSMDEFDPLAPGYLEAAQSFMLLDRQGNIRVRNSKKMAKRTIVAEQTDGKILVILTKWACSLWELANWILEGPFAVRQAMSMDGGEEAQLAVRAGGFIYPQELADIQQAQWEKPLPTVIGIFPRESHAMGLGGESRPGMWPERR